MDSSLELPLHCARSGADSSIESARASARLVRDVTLESPAGILAFVP
jgi:hypothetical protein